MLCASIYVVFFSAKLSGSLQYWYRGEMSTESGANGDMGTEDAPMVRLHLLVL